MKQTSDEELRKLALKAFGNFALFMVVKWTIIILLNRNWRKRMGQLNQEGE